MNSIEFSSFPNSMNPNNHFLQPKRIPSPSNFPITPSSPNLQPIAKTLINIYLNWIEIGNTRSKHPGPNRLNSINKRKNILNTYLTIFLLMKYPEDHDRKSDYNERS